MCERTTTESEQYRSSDFKVNDLTEEVCSTFTTELRDKDNLLYELQLYLENYAVLEDGKYYNLILTTAECEDLRQTNATLQCGALPSDEMEYISREFTIYNGIYMYVHAYKYYNCEM